MRNKKAKRDPSQPRKINLGEGASVEFEWLYGGKVRARITSETPRGVYLEATVRLDWDCVSYVINNLAMEYAKERVRREEAMNRLDKALGYK